MHVDLTNKTAIVTGGARDIGRAIVLELAKNGANVVVNYHSSGDAAKAVVDEVKRGGKGKAVAAQADVATAAGAKRLVEQARDAFGETIDILVNNGGGLIARKELDE